MVAGYSDEQYEFCMQLREMGLHLRDIPGDGDQIEGTGDNHMYYREAAANYMMKHRRDFEPFLEEECSFKEYVNKLRQERTYAGNDALVAIARHFAVKIVIHQACGPLWIIEGGCCHAPEVHIAYHSGDHYSSVRRIGDTSDKPARISLCDVKKYAKDKMKNTPAPYNLEELIDEVMIRTECRDLRKVQKLLKSYGYNANKVVAYLLGKNPCRIEAEEDEECDFGKSRAYSSVDESECEEQTISSRRSGRSSSRCNGECQSSSSSGQKSGRERQSTGCSCQKSSRKSQSRSSFCQESEERNSNCKDSRQQSGPPKYASCHREGPSRPRNCENVADISSVKKKPRLKARKKMKEYMSDESNSDKCSRKKKKERKELPIVTKNLSDLIVNPKSAASQLSVDSGIMKQSASDLGLNVTLGVICAFLVYCLFKAF